jgi:hypothetical protein
MGSGCAAEDRTKQNQETAASTVTHIQHAERPTCEVFMDKPVFIAPLISVTFGENFYRTVMQAYRRYIAARAIEEGVWHFF